MFISSSIKDYNENKQISAYVLGQKVVEKFRRIGETMKKLRRTSDKSFSQIIVRFKEYELKSVNLSRNHCSSNVIVRNELRNKLG